jgi:hypothetical protein
MPTLHWIGKDKVVSHHQEVPYRVLEHKYGFTAPSASTGQATQCRVRARFTSCRCFSRFLRQAQESSFCMTLLFISSFSRRAVPSPDKSRYGTLLLHAFSLERYHQKKR